MRKEEEPFGNLLNSEGNEERYDHLLNNLKRNCRETKIVIECNKCRLGPCNSDKGLKCEGIEESSPGLQQIAHSRNEKP